MTPVSHPGRLLKRELAARRLSANRLSLDIGVPSGCELPASPRETRVAQIALRIRGMVRCAQVW